MNLLVPAALGVLALVGPLVALYMLRSKRRTVAVSSVMLWERSERDVTSATPWKKLDFTTLLLLQLLALAFFALSLARPFFAEATVLGPHTVFVVDVSGSMAEAGRFESALAEAERLAEDASDANLVSVIEAGSDPRVVAAFVRDPSVVADALGDVRLGGGEADLDEAIRLARGLATPDRPSTVVIFSDGGSAPSSLEPIIAATHLSFDDIGDNVTIAAFTVETVGSGTTNGFLSVTNHSLSSRSETFEVASDSGTIHQVEMELPPGETVNRTFLLEPHPGDLLTVSRLGEPDGNPLDDRTWAVIDSVADRTVSVVSGGSPFIEALVDIAPGFTLVDDDEDAEPADGDPSETPLSGADIHIIDGGSVASVDRPSLVIRTTEPPAGLTLRGFVENTVVTFQQPAEPVLDGVDLSRVAVAEAQVVEPRGWLPIVRAGDVPLVLLGDVDGHRVAYLTFDLTHSNLPVDVSYPILGTALLSWLGGDRGASVGSGPAGTPLPLATPPGASVRVTMPGGDIVEPAAGSVRFTDTGVPGPYVVEYISEGVTVGSSTVIRTFVAEESAAAPRTIATAPLADGDTGPAEILREWAPQLIGVILLLLLIEWWVGHQRPVLRRAT